MQAEKADVVVIGAGAAGLFCAAQMGFGSRQVVVLDNGKKAGRKIIMSGGGRCNFTNLTIDANHYLSQNPHFCKSALARYTQWDFISLVDKYQIPWYEKEAGQLFCLRSSQDIVQMLLHLCDQAQVAIRLQHSVRAVEPQGNDFLIKHSRGRIIAKAVVVATGGLSMSALGSSPLGYQIAEKFNLPIISPRSALVPFVLNKSLLKYSQTLSGISLPVRVTSESGISFQGNMLFTHTGLSGPAILQISNYWQVGQEIMINLLPDVQLADFFATAKEQHPEQTVKNVLSSLLPKRLLTCLQQLGIVADVNMKQLTDPQQKLLIEQLVQWRIRPERTAGYQRAEVTGGGVDTRALSSKTMQVESVPGLFFIGEVVDVTGWLGGYNFQWAWSSAWACAHALINNK